MFRHLPLNWLLLAGLLSLSFALPAREAVTLKDILNLQQAPDGVVIEIVTGDNAGLNWALPKAEGYIQKLRQRFTELPIAIVTHGREQFALTRKNRDSRQQEHQTVRSLTQQNNVQVHVCGTYAGWRGLSDEDFPDYVDVAAAGPAQINDYLSLGYLLIVIKSDGNVFD